MMRPPMTLPVHVWEFGPRHLPQMPARHIAAARWRDVHPKQGHNQHAAHDQHDHTSRQDNSQPYNPVSWRPSHRSQSSRAAIWLTLHGWSATPAAIAGVRCKVL